MQSNKQFIFSLSIAALVLGVLAFVFYTVVTQSGFFGDDQTSMSNESTENGDQAAPVFTGHLVYDLYTQELDQAGVPIQNVDARVFSLNGTEIQDEQLYSDRIFYGVDSRSSGSGVGIIRDPETDRDIALDFDLAADEYNEIVSQLDTNVRSVFAQDQWYIGEAITRTVVSDQDAMDLSSWSVFIYNINTQESVFIPNATSPQFLADGTGLLYIKSDGIYQYTFGAVDSPEALVPSPYIGLTARDEMAISANGQYVVVTQPDSSLYRVLEFTPAGLVSLQEVVNENTVFTSPIFHPEDNQLFALVTYPIDRPITYSLQVSTITNNTVTQLVENSVESLFMVTITDWTTDNPTSSL
jgi:hypothetical protein